MPTGRIRFFNEEKGFGFISTDEDDDIFVHISAFPTGTQDVKSGTKVDFSVAEGRKGRQALSVRIVAQPASVVRAKRESPDEFAKVVQDAAKELDDLAVQLYEGHYPDGKTSKAMAKVLRALADKLDV